MRHRLIALFVIVIASALIAGCTGDGGDSDSAESAVQKGDGFTVSIDASPELAAPGRNISLTLTVRNVSGEPRTFDFSDAQTFDFTAYDEGGGKAWQWSDGQMFIQVISSETIEPGDSRVYKTSLDTLILEPAEYTVEGVFLGLPDLKPRVGIRIEAGKVG